MLSRKTNSNYVSLFLLPSVVIHFSHLSSSFSSTHTHIHTQECVHAHTHACTQTHIWTDHLKIRDAFSLNILIILRGRRTNPLLPHNWDGEWELYRLKKSLFPPWIVMSLSCTRSACSGLIKSFSFFYLSLRESVQNEVQENSVETYIGWAKVCNKVIKCISKSWHCFKTLGFFSHCEILVYAYTLWKDGDSHTLILL